MNAATQNRPGQTLQCMEIHGGTQATERAVATPGLDVWVYCRPHRQAAFGGDVYYVSLCGGGMITRLILADVSGHGDSVAELGKSLRALMRKNINRKDQSRLVRALNAEFNGLQAAGHFATAVVATYLTRGDRLTVCNAGHPRPLWWRAATRTWCFVSHEGETAGAGPANLPLGVLDDTGYTQVEITLGRDDLVLFYTDALTEAEDPDRRQLGEAGLLDLLQRLDPDTPADLPAALVAGLEAYRGRREANDDATFILLRHNGDPSRSPGFLETLNVYAKMLGLKSV